MIRTTLFAACAVLIAPAALAGSPVTVERPSVQTETVYFADLNLASDRGVSAVKNRIRAAAQRVCNIQPIAVDELAGQLRGKACLTGALRDSHRQLDELLDARAGGAVMSTASLTVRGR